MTTELTEDEWREATTYDLIDWHRTFSTEGERDAAWDRFLASVRRDAKAEAWDAFRESLAGHLNLATPRAWGFHHPCDPPGVRWEPTERDKALMDVADMLREDTANPYRAPRCPEEAQ